MFSFKPSTLNEIQQIFHQIVLTTYERALYLKCLFNELTIPASFITVLKDKGLITESICLKIRTTDCPWFFLFLFLNISEELVHDLLHGTDTEETSLSRRPSRLSVGIGSNNEEVKSVKFASSSSPTISSSQNKPESTTLNAPPVVEQSEEQNTILTIQSLLQ